MNNDEYIIKYNDDYVHYEGDYLYISPFKVTLKQNIGGTISATPMTGYKGDTVTLSSNTNEGYILTNYSISGANLYDTNKFNFGSNDVTCEGVWDIDYNPLNLPPYTIQLKYQNGVTPTFAKGTGVQISTSPNIWNLTYENSDWTQLLFNHTKLLSVLGGNTSGVSSMNSMYGMCNVLSSVSLYDTRNTTGMNGVFAQCYVLSSIPQFDTKNVTSMANMFVDCLKMKNVPYLNTSKVVDMHDMFISCSSLKSIPDIDTSNVTSMEGMFDYCKNLVVPPNIDTHNVTTMYRMFRYCSSLSSVPLYDTTNVTSMRETFSGCVNVVSGALALYQQASTQTNPPTDHRHAFSYCGRDTQTGSAELAQIPDEWKY